MPILLKLFSVKDTHVRLILLQFFELFVRSFEDEDLKDFILPQVKSVILCFFVVSTLQCYRT